ncbi:MAG: polysaccharide biosynthesis tyrosine autokinase, partial [Bacteroidota bacterium]
MLKKKIININDEFDAKLLVYIIRKNIFWIFSFFIIALIAGLLYLRYTHPIFEANAVLQFGNDNTAKVLFKQDNLEEEGIEKDLELLRSPVFLSRVFAKLPLQVSYFVKGWILDFETYKNSPFVAYYRIKDPAIYGTPMNVEFIDVNRYRLDYMVQNTGNQLDGRIGEWISFPHLDIRLEWKDKKTTSKPAASHYFIINNPDAIYAVNASRLNLVILSSIARTVELRYQDRNASKAADIINEILNEYQSYDIERKAESANQVLDFIDLQLDTVFNRLYQAELQLKSYRKINFGRFSNQTSSMLEANEQSRMNEMEAQVSSLEYQESVLNEIESTVTKTADLDVYKLIALIAGSDLQGGTLSGMLSALEQLYLKKEQMLYDVTSKSSQIESINFQIDIQKKLLIESVKSLRNNIRKRRIDLAGKLIEQNKKILALIPVDTTQVYNTGYTTMLREYSINEKYYNQLLEKKTEYSIMKAGYVTKNKILQYAVTPSSPISPNKRFIMLTAIAVGLLISFILVLIRYLLHNFICVLNDISAYVDTPILGMVPRYRKEIPVSQLIVDKRPKSLIAESLRAVRTNLQFIGNEPGPKVIAITSTISGEGKTFVAINLAGVIAFSGKKVIIIDSDMRKPKIHQGFGVENICGLSTILVGKDEMDFCIQKSQIENLDFITAGPVPPNPSELIMSEKMSKLIETLKETYEVIIIDNPPVGLVTDGIANLQRADYPIFVFKANYSRRHFIENIVRLIEENEIKKLSIILNAVEIMNSNYGFKRSQGYGYSYGYGYGYG